MAKTENELNETEEDSQSDTKFLDNFNELVSEESHVLASLDFKQDCAEFLISHVMIFEKTEMSTFTFASLLRQNSAEHFLFCYGWRAPTYSSYDYALRGIFTYVKHVNQFTD